MPHAILRPFALAGLLAIWACSDSAVAPSGRDDLRARVAALGFGTAGMQDHGDYVVVEGDIVLNKAALLGGAGKAKPTTTSIGSLVPGAPRQQWGTTQLVSNTYVRQITVDLSQLSGEPNWTQAARNAMADYNALNTAVHISEASSADITMYMISSFDDGTVAQASWPRDASTSGKPGPTIHISQAFDNYSVAVMEKVLVHELGHTLGMRHSDWQSIGETVGSEGATQVWQTDPTDPNSVMNHCVCGTEWGGFSAGDITAFNILYPYLTVAISGRQFVTAPGTYRYSATVSGGTASSYYYTWQVRYCYQYPCGDGPFETFAEGVGVSSASMSFTADDFIRDIYLTVQEYSGGIGGKGYGLITVDGPSQ